MRMEATPRKRERIRRRCAFVIALTWLAVLPPCSIVAQEATSSFVTEEEISVDAEEISYDQRSDTIEAFGHVVVRRGELQLEAEEIRISRSTNEASARGKVLLTTPESHYAAEEVYLNLDDETGFLRDAALESESSQFTLLGDYIEKREGQCYRIEDGSFTTCRCAEGKPSWSIASDELEIELNGYGTIKGGKFEVLGVPVLYIPWAFFPITTERQSGLLGPRFGASDRRGFQILQPYYWAINKSHDVTIALDVETSARVGLVGEHRYAFSRDISGSLGATYFNESFRGNPEGLSLRERIPENRWSVRSDHRHQNLLGGEFYVDAFVVGDDGFLREMNVLATDHTRDVALRTLQFTDSRIGFLRPWERFFIKVEGTYYQDLDLAGIVQATPTPEGGVVDPTPAPTPAAREPRSDTLTLQRAPAIEAYGQARVAGPLLADVSTSLFSYQRGTGTDGLRFDLEPSLTLALPLGRYLFGNVQASVRETAYHLLQTEESEALTLEQNPTREMFTLRANVGTAAARVYPVRFAGLDAIQHLIEPRLEYLYVPDVAQDDLPIFDSVDRIGSRNLVTYGIATRVMGRFRPQDGESRNASDVRELARMWVAQSVDVERRLPSVAQNVVREDHFSDIDIGAAVHPFESVSLLLDSKFDHGASELTAARVGVFLENPWADEEEDARLGIRSRAGVTYRFLTGNEVKEIDASFELKLARWLGFLYAVRYDVVESRFLDQHYGMRLLSRCDCWALDLGFTDRTNPDEIEAKIELTLVGLGYGSPFSFDSVR